MQLESFEFEKKCLHCGEPLLPSDYAELLERFFDVPETMEYDEIFAELLAKTARDAFEPILPAVSEIFLRELPHGATPERIKELPSSLWFEAPEIERLLPAAVRFLNDDLGIPATLTAKNNVLGIRRLPQALPSDKADPNVYLTESLLPGVVRVWNHFGMPATLFMKDRGLGFRCGEAACLHCGAPLSPNEVDYIKQTFARFEAASPNYPKHWHFHESYDQESRTYWYKRLIKHATQQVTECVEGVLQLFESHSPPNDVTHVSVSKINSIGLLTCVALERGTFLPGEMFIYAGPFDWVNQKQDAIKAQMEHNALESSSIRRNIIIEKQHPER